MSSNSPSPQNSLLSANSLEEIEQWKLKFPQDRSQSALLAALQIVQHQNHGYLTTELMDAVADYLQLSKIAVYEVASFYSMYELEKVGRHNIAICTNISCMLMGSDTIVDYIEQKLGVKTGESTADGKFYLKCEEECLAACSSGPMMQVNHVYHTALTPEKIDTILDALN